MLIPEIEKGALRLRIVTAEELAQEGKLGVGFISLVNGLHAALQAAARGEPWAASLAVCYGEAIEEYTRRYPVHMD